MRIAVECRRLSVLGGQEADMSGKWQSYLLIGLVLLLVSSASGCKTHTQEDSDVGQWDKAIIDLTKAIDSGEVSADIYASRAMAYNEKGMYDLAISDCEKARELDPLVKLDSSLARAYVKRGEYNAQFIDGAPWDDEDKQDFEESISAYTMAIKLDPKLAEAYKGRADCYVAFYEEDGDFGDRYDYHLCISDFTQAIALDPTNADYYRGRARAYDMGGDYDREVIDLTQAIDFDPTNTGYYLSRGLAYKDMGSYDSAVADLTIAIELDPADGFAYEIRCEVYLAKGNYDLAISDCTIAISLELSRDPDSWWLYYLYSARGDAYTAKGSYDLAIKDYTTSIEGDPAEGWYKSRALAYLKKGDYEMAIADSSQAINIYSEYDEAFWIRGQAYMALGQNDKAVSDFQQCLALSESMEQYNNQLWERNEQVREWILALESANGV
jgi:tetratricopeptide (TPR) repeat protein